MKNYWVSFGSSDPRTFTGLSPTFIQFFNQLGQTLLPPGITEIFAGSGAYRFQYSSGYSTSIFFTVDGGATLAAGLRYVRGVLDPIDTLDLVLGYTASSIGSTSTDPSDALGYLKRALEFREGEQNFLKNSGEWSIYSRGASTLLRTKVLTNSTTGVTAL